MSNFNGFTKVELEIMLDQMGKALPAVKALTPTFAQLVRANYDALKEQGFEDRELLQLAVLSTGKQLGLQ
jgi:hypothetical protein